MMEKRTETAWMRLQEEPLDAAHALAFLQTPAAGGINIFVGTTRQWTGGRETATLFYEAYAPMALREMTTLADEAGRRWDAVRVCLWHRLGEVPLGEASVLIGVATAHRDAAFEACRYLIDTLKRDVPVWKREHYADGATEWVQPRHDGSA